MRNDRRVDSCKPTANKRDTQSVYDYVVAACEKVEFIVPRSE
jgi:hypothetical protein